MKHPRKAEAVTSILMWVLSAERLYAACRERGRREAARRERRHCRKLFEALPKEAAPALPGEPGRPPPTIRRRPFPRASRPTEARPDAAQSLPWDIAAGHDLPRADGTAIPTTLLATGFAKSGGGTAAATIARLGGYACSAGRGPARMHLAGRIIGQLSGQGSDVTGVRRIPGCASPFPAILVANDGERPVRAHGDPRLDYGASWPPLDQVAGFDTVHCDARWPLDAAADLDAAAAPRIRAVLGADIVPSPEVLADLARRARSGTAHLRSP